jgi:23S rRNA pseudouridine2605 synthase
MKRAMTRKSKDDRDRTRPPRRDRGPPRARPGLGGDRPRHKGQDSKPPGAPDSPPAPLPPPKESNRIAKVIARAGVTSRREAEDWIAAGRVAVNGTVITSPALNVTAADRITIDDAPLPARERTRLFLYNKPRGLVTTNADPEGRPTIFEGLPSHLPRLLSIGRLDIGTEGLLLLTNDGGLARVLELPETGWLRRYRVRALGKVTQGDLDGLRDGVTVDGIHYGPIEATLDREQGFNVWLTFAIREGKNREVRNVLGHLGLQVNRLIRLSFGPFQLGELTEGAVEEIRTRTLREQLGERIIAEASCDFSAPIVDRPAQVEVAEPRRDERAREDRGERPRHERDDKRSDGPRREHRPREDHGARPRHDREERPLRPRGDDRRPERPPRRDEPRRDDRRRNKRREDERPEKPGRPRRGDAWRKDDAPLRRHYRGGRLDTRPPPDEPAAPKRAGLLVDRKGRRVLVERFGEKKAEKPRDTRPPRRGKSRRPDRSSGPRPSRPGGRPKDR